MPGLSAALESRSLLPDIEDLAWLMDQFLRGWRPSIQRCAPTCPVEDLGPDKGARFYCRRVFRTECGWWRFSPVGEIFGRSHAVAPSRILRWFPRSVARQTRRSCGERDDRSLRREIPQQSPTVCPQLGRASVDSGTLPDPLAKKSALIFGTFAPPGFLACRCPGRLIDKPPAIGSSRWAPPERAPWEHDGCAC